MNAVIEIGKVKLKNGLFVEVEYRKLFDDGKFRNEVSESCNAPVHEDLLAAFKKLAPHLTLLTEYMDESSAPEDLDEWAHPAIEPFKVTQISIGGDGDGVTITGQRKLKSGKVLNLNAPFTKYHEEEGYRFGVDLQLAVEVILNETQQYMEGKHGEGAQLEMSFDEEQDNLNDEAL